MFLFFSLRLSNLVTLNTTKRKEKKRTERYGTEVNSVQFIESPDFARNSNFLQISHHSYVNRATKIGFLSSKRVKRKNVYYHLYVLIFFFNSRLTQRKFNLWHFIIFRNSSFSFNFFFFSYIRLIFFFKWLILKSRSSISQARFLFADQKKKKTSYDFGTISYDDYH